MKPFLFITLLSIAVIGCSHSVKNNITSDSIDNNSNNYENVNTASITDSKLEVYKEVLDTLNTNGDSLIQFMYFTYDLIGDSIPELWLKTGTCEADYILYVYTCDNGKIRKVLETEGGHSDFFPYNDEMICVTCNTGSGYVSRLIASESGIEIKSSEFSTWNDNGEPLADDKSFNPLLKYWEKNWDKHIQFNLIFSDENMSE